MKLRPAFSHCFSLIALLGVLPCLSACGQKVEETEAFKVLAERLDRIDKDIDAIHRSNTITSRDVQQISLDLAAAGKGSGASPQLIAALEQRLVALETVKVAGGPNAALEGRLASLEQKLGAKPIETAAAPAPPAATVPAASPAAEAPPAGEGSKQLVVTPKAGKTREVAAAPAVAKPASASAASSSGAIQRGIYHKVGPSESLDQIAKSYKLAPNVILAANNLPAGRRLVAGQQIFVPVTSR